MKWRPFKAIPSLLDLLVFVVPDLTLVLSELSTLLDLLQKEFGNLLLRPRVLDLLSIVSKLEEIPLSSLLGDNLKFFVWKNFFLELDEHDLMPPCLS